MESIMGFKSLTKKQQKLLIDVNTKHKAGVGVDEKDGFTPVKVVPDHSRLRVWFKNGLWLYYTEKGEWY